MEIKLYICPPPCHMLCFEKRYRISHTIIVTDSSPSVPLSNSPVSMFWIRCSRLVSLGFQDLECGLDFY